MIYMFFSIALFAQSLDGVKHNRYSNYNYIHCNVRSEVDKYDRKSNEINKTEYRGDFYIRINGESVYTLNKSGDAVIWFGDCIVGRCSINEDLLTIETGGGLDNYSHIEIWRKTGKLFQSGSMLGSNYRTKYSGEGECEKAENPVQNKF